jgi:ribosomal protein S18 acetylase RimI-like enzyme
VNEYEQFLRQTGQTDEIEPWITKDYFSHYVESKTSFVAVIDEKVVGFILAKPTSYVRNAKRETWLEYIAVLPELRKRGIGSSLISKVLDNARSKDVAVLHTALNPNNDESSRFLLKHGFEIRDWKLATRKLNHARPDLGKGDK